MDEIVTELINIIEDITDIPKDKIEKSSSLLEDLNISSFEMMSIVAEIESKYSIKLADDMLDIVTVNDLAAYIETKFEA